MLESPQFSFVPLFEEFQILFIEMSFLRMIREKETKMDSTPLETSRYDAYAITIHIMNVK